MLPPTVFAYEFELSGELELLGILGCQMEVLDVRPQPDLLSEEEVNFWHGDGVANEVQFSRTALPRRLESNMAHRIELTEGVYQLEVSAFVDTPGTGALSVRRVEE